MKKIILCILLALTFTLSISAITTAAAVSGYGIFIGDVEITQNNASDVLGDGKVSFDKDTNTLTLNGAKITEYSTLNIENVESQIAIYNTVSGLNVNLIGENEISVFDKEKETSIAIYSKEKISFLGEGTLISKSFKGIFCEKEIEIKDCTISFLNEGIICYENDVTVDDATLSSRIGLINTNEGNITLKNTTIPHGGKSFTLVSETGTIYVENCNITTDGKDFIWAEESPSLTIKNTVLNVKSNSYAIFAPLGNVTLEGVSGTIDCQGEYAAAIGGNQNVSLTDCELTLTNKASADSAFAILGNRDIVINDSKLKIEVLASEESGIGIGILEEIGDVNIKNTFIDMSITAQTAIGLSASNVKLNGCITKIRATSLGENGIGAGIVGTTGTAIITDGVLDIVAKGSSNEYATSSAIILQLPSLSPVIINADVKLVGNCATSNMLDISLYTKDYEITASPCVDGSDKVEEFNKDNFADIKYLHIHPFYNITFNANGGSGEMKEILDHYGLFTLPENAFTPPYGKVFKGWSNSENGEIIEGSSLEIHADLTLFAIWENSTEKPPLKDDPSHVHDYSTEWKYDQTNHWQECACEDKKNQKEHIDSNSNGSCDICGYKMQVQTPSKKKGCKSTLNGDLGLLFITSLICTVYITRKKRNET